MRARDVIDRMPVLKLNMMSFFVDLLSRKRTVQKLGFKGAIIEWQTSRKFSRPPQL